jgi:hypothetical protein
MDRQNIEFHLSTEEEIFNLEAKGFSLGRDLIISIFGGDLPHIGAVGIAHPRPSLKKPNEISSTASVYCVLGHKEDIIAKEASERIAAALNRNVVVTVGIHWDHISDPDIQVISGRAKALIEKIIEHLKPEAS